MLNRTERTNKFTDDNLSCFQRNLYQVYLRRISVTLIQRVGFFLIFFILINHPVDYIFFSPVNFYLIVKWRLFVSLNLLVAIGGVSLSDRIRKYFDCYFMLIFLVASILTVSYTFPIGDIANGPRYIVCMLPLVSIILPSDLPNRIVITSMPILTIAGWIVLSDLNQVTIAKNIAVLLITLGSTLSTILIGHFLFFRLNRRNFFQSRQLKLTEREAKEAHREAEASRLEAEQEREKSEALLDNILPKKVSDRLKAGEEVSENYDEVTVLFADIVEFTPIANQLPAREVVSILDDIFSSFDDLVNQFGLEKIKTIGDEYFVASGVPETIEDHALRMTNLAYAMKDEVKRHDRHDGSAFQLRCGMNTGPLVAGIIGKEKFVYDVWGMTVNVGSRMENQGKPGEIHLTEATKNALEKQSNGGYEFKKRDPITIKGKGKMTTYFLRKTDHD